MTTVSKLTAKWDSELPNPPDSTSSGKYNSLHQQIEFFAKHHYNEYLPTLAASHPQFLDRLDNWLHNPVTDDEKRLMLEYVPFITFLTSGDFGSLYEAAFRGPIARWIIELLGLALDDPELTSSVSKELSDHTWFCPLTDSMHISSFHHVNNIGGVDLRPDFRSLVKFGDKNKILAFMCDHADRTGRAAPLKRIVLLEDFVGSGFQTKKSLYAAVRCLDTIPILYVPLVICPAGSAAARRVASRYANLTYDPVIELTESDLINEASPLDPTSLADRLRRLAVRSYPAVAGPAARTNDLPYGPFGFKDTGAVLVMYSNTPANSLPLLHHQSDEWRPLFPRSARIR
jgi:hypothetical protein